MKFTIMFMLISTSQIFGSVYSQSTKLSIDVKDGSLTEVFRQIEEQSEFKFLYHDALLGNERNVNIKVRNKTVEEILNSLFSSSDNSFTVLDNNLVVITPKDSREKQGVTITGTVTDAATGEPIPGVNVYVRDMEGGTVTDLDGKYEITLPTDNATLVFSFVGYGTKEVAVTGRTVIDVSMEGSFESLDEVVVIGYGVQKKKLTTGATAQVKGEDLERRNTTSVLQALQGQTSGVNITSTSGQPGEDMKVIVRGLGTIGEGGPLYIVDGVPTEDIKYLNSADIESIDVLKDAASAAIYGSRAANGVVLITTKQGVEGKAQITLDVYYGIQNRAKDFDLLSARDYAMIMNEQEYNSTRSSENLPFDLTNLPAYTREGSANTDWLDQMFVKNVPTQNYNLGVIGGNDLTTYAFSLSYTGQEGIVGGKDHSNYERYSARFNSENKLYDDRIKIGQHLTYAFIKKKGIQVGNQYGNSMRGAFNASPLLPVYDDNGNFFNTNDTTIKDQFGELYWHNTESNPYAEMVLNNQNQRNTQKLVGDVYAEIQLLKNLTFRTKFGMDYFSEDYRAYKPIYELSFYSFNEYNTAVQDMSKGARFLFENLIFYDLNLNKSSFNAMIGMSSEQYNGSWLKTENSDLVFDDLEHSYLDNATNQDWAKLKIRGAADDEEKLLSYFGRIQYNYNETYLFNATLRTDGSSKFAKGNRWGYFPSFSAGWVLTNENFLSTAGSYLDFLKLRASWGQNGNQSIPSFNYLAPITFTHATYAFGEEEGINTPGSYPSRLANEKLKWETSEQINVGFDSRFFNTKLSIVFDWYKKTTKGWLIKAPVLATAGTNWPIINGGSVINSGVELGMGYSNRIGDLSFNFNTNVAYNQNEVQEIPTEDGIIHGRKNELYNNSEEFYRAESGFPIGYFWGYETDGLFQKDSDVTDYKNSEDIVIQPTAKAGDVKFVDQDDNGVIDDDDKVMVGDPNPDLIFGLSVSLEWQGIDFSVFANGVTGNQIVQSYRNHTGKYSNYSTSVLDRWNGSGTSTSLPRVTNSNTNYIHFSDLFVQDGAYLRISNVTLGYDLSRIVNVENFSQCRIYFSAQNLLTFTGYNGMDPEVGYGFDNGESDKYSSGIDLGFYPRPRVFLIGANVKF